MTMRAFVAAGAALAAIAFAAGCSREVVPEKRPTPVRVQTIETHAGSGGNRYSATIEPYERVDLAFKVGGYVAGIRQVRGIDGRGRAVQEGDRVAKGDVLASIRQEDYREVVAQARAGLAQAEAAVAKAEADYGRASALFAKRSLTKADDDAARAALDGARAAADGARARVAEAENALADTELRSPIEGVVLKRAIEAGSLAGPGTLGFVVADTATVKAVFGVPDFVVQRLAMGGTVEIATEAIRGVDFPGRITRIAPIADPRSRVFEVELTMPNADGRLKVGMIASLTLPDAVPGEPVPVVPITAIVRPRGRSDGYGVYVLEEKEGRTVARAREVTLGDAFGNTIAVTGGVKAGERVIVVGATLVEDGGPVRVIP